MPSKPQPRSNPSTDNAAEKKSKQQSGARANAWAKPLVESKAEGKPKAPPGLAGTALASNATAGASTKAQALRDRVLHVTLSLIGSVVTVTLVNGTVIEGVFHTFTPFEGLASAMRNKVVLKSCRVVKLDDSDGTLKGFQSGSTLVVSANDVACIHSKQMEWEDSKTRSAPLAAKGSEAKSSRGAGAGFNTDTEISGRQGGRNRDLVAAGSAWTSAAAKDRKAEEPTGRFANLQSSNQNGGLSGLRGNIGGWDQFKANKQLFNVNASFDENLYTTHLDKSSIDNSKRAEAERIAKEIENTASKNIHVAEERGHKVETDYDEEDRFSGVLTSSGKNRHEVSAAQGNGDGGASADAKPAGAKPQKPAATMNYAAAAAKADVKTDKVEVAKGTPPGFSSSKSDSGATEITEKKPSVGKKNAPTIQADGGKEGAVASKKKSDGNETPTNDPSKSKQGEAPAIKEKKSSDPASLASNNKSSKLNANAKEFTFNPSAKTFTPGVAAPAPPSQIVSNPTSHEQIPMSDGNHHPVPPGSIHPAHFMQPPTMNQPGVMNVMGVPYNHMYQNAYPNMEQQQHSQAHAHAHQMQPTMSNPNQYLPQPPKGAGDGEAKNNGDGGGGGPVDGEANKPQRQNPHQQAQQQQQQQQPQPHASIPQYGIPPHVAYYGGGMNVPGHNPGYPQNQFAAGAQPMHMGPNGVQYRPVYPVSGGVVPPMHVTGAPQTGYGQAPMGYPGGQYMQHGPADDMDPSGRGRGGRGHGGRGRRSGRGRGRGSGRGGGGYQGYNSQPGRHVPNNNESHDSKVSNRPSHNNGGGGGGGSKPTTNAEPE